MGCTHILVFLMWIFALSSAVLLRERVDVEDEVERTEDCVEERSEYNQSRVIGLNCSNRTLDEVPKFFDLTSYSSPVYDRVLLNDNNMQMVKKNDFNGVEVRLLNLSSNEIATISDHGFNGIVGLEELYLAHNELTSAPLALRDVSDVRILDLRDNRIASLHDESFADLLGLEYLDLSGNMGIQFLTPFRAFESLQSLRYLNLSRCGLPNLPTDALQHLTQLRSLVMRDNDISVILNDVFSQNSQLEELDLTNNPVQIPAEKSAFNGLSNLQMLRFAGCSIPELTRDFFDDIDFRRKLVELRVSDCSIEFIERGLLGKMTRLAILDIAGNPGADLDSDPFEGLENSLEQLSIGRLNLTRFPIQALRSLRRLRKIKADGNKIRSLKRDELKGLHSDLDLSLADNDIEVVSSRALRELQGRASLDLSGNNLTSIRFIASDPCDFNHHAINLTDNPILCDCTVFKMVQMKALDVQGACAEPAIYQGLVLSPDLGQEPSFGHLEVDKNATEACQTQDRQYQRYDCSCDTWLPLASPRICAVTGGATGVSVIFSNILIMLTISGLVSNYMYL